ncbi:MULTISPECIES: isoprenyl transferase [Paenibacillus]|uniref:isoprenyl transferase n=1 Tax=Paenibacillus TaxID=44249 RepID=UPI0022B87E53|nr:isoprenyl transferase [Paenibacillus caseinilyticus]MCZ8520021.1 isoprenyl transferase [Paenibacillus caseinilyticus]
MIPFKKWFGSNTEGEDSARGLAADNIPNHVAVIMDGNGRWAQKRGLPRVAGHHSGMKNVKKITMAANSIGVNVLTLYAFSTENWKRPKEEVDYLMKLPLEFFPKEIDELVANNVRIRMTGWQEGLPEYTLKAVQDAIDRTANNTGLILNFALNYGSRKEMLRGIQQIAQDAAEGKLKPEEIDEARFSKYLLTDPLPDPDLLIRTSGELRISNFMLWQLAYSELVFTDLCWPEFTEEHFFEAVQEYQRRARRYGGL